MTPNEEINEAEREYHLREERKLWEILTTHNLQFQVVVRGCGVYSHEDGLRGGSDEPQGQPVPLRVGAGGGLEVELDQPRLAPPLVCSRLWKV